MSPSALVTGSLGQDGSYLSEHLLSLGYTVYGMVAAQDVHFQRLTESRGIPGVEYIPGDLLDYGSLLAAVKKSQPDEIYNLGGLSFAPDSFAMPELVSEVNGLGCLRLLEIIRTYSPETRLYQASSSHMFGDAKYSPQHEGTPFKPNEPYSIAKLFAHQIVRYYRKAYGLHASCGICFNHESPRRPKAFVTRKVTSWVARLWAKLEAIPVNRDGDGVKLQLGNMDARRDWGFAGDYVKAMHLMLQQEKPDDYVIATGETHSIKGLCYEAFSTAGLNWEEWVEHDPGLLRPADIAMLVGDASKAQRVLGWQPETSFKQLISMMVKADIAELRERADGRIHASA